MHEVHICTVWSGLPTDLIWLRHLRQTSSHTLTTRRHYKSRDRTVRDLLCSCLMCCISLVSVHSLTIVAINYYILLSSICINHCEKDIGSWYRSLHYFAHTHRLVVAHVAYTDWTQTWDLIAPLTVASYLGERSSPQDSDFFTDNTSP